MAKKRSAQPPDFDGEIGEVISDISKLHGDKVVRRADLKVPWKHIPLGIFTLDMAMLGGVPEGMVTLFYGWEHSGKTTLAMRAIAGAQKKYPNKKAVFVDIEGSYSPEWGEQHGIDNSQMVLVQPDTGEQAMDITVAMIKANEVSIVVVDSIAMLTPTAEIEKSFEDAIVGKQALMVSRFCRQAHNALCSEAKRGHRPAVVMINQFRMKIGVMHGDPRTLPGGVAQNYMYGIKVEIKNKEFTGVGVDDISTVTHNEHAFAIKKNKVGTAVRTGEFKMIRDPGHPLGMGYVDDAKTAITWAKKMGLVTGGSPKVRVHGIDRDFRILADIEAFFQQHPEEYEEFRHTLISTYRDQCKLNAQGWYLDDATPAKKKEEK